MKKYPSIKTKIDLDTHVVGFDKLDGSNIRAFWKSSEKRFIDFGTRTLRLKRAHKYLGSSIDLIKSKYEKELTQIFLDKNYKEVTAFFEFFGNKSFAGRHNIDDKKQVVLIDLMIYKKGLIHPEEFIKDYGHLSIPSILFKGKLEESTIRLIKKGELPNMELEGVVFKGRGGKKGNYPIMFKIKSDKWITKLKDFCGEDEELFRKML